MASTIFTVSELMYELVSGTGPVWQSDLHCLADLSDAEADELHQFWLLVSSRRRVLTAEGCLHLLRSSKTLQFKVFFCYLLTDPDFRIRVLAAKGLGSDVYFEVLPYLELAATQDESDAVRLAAVQALGQFFRVGEERFWVDKSQSQTRKILSQLISDPDQSLVLQCAALESIGYSPGALFEPKLLDAYRSELEELRVSALVAMGRSGYRHWENRILEACNDQSGTVRTAAVKAGGMLGIEDLGDICLYIIELETDSQLRIAAIEALGRLGGPTAYEGLMLAAESEDQEQQEAVLRALDGYETEDIAFLE